MPSGHDFVARLGTFLDNISCLHCAGDSALICNGSADDIKALGRRGSCLQPMHVLFEKAYLLTNSYYIRYGNNFTTFLCPRPLLQLHSPHLEFDPSPPGARSRYGNDGTPIVSVGVDVKKYDMAAHYSLFYILLH